MKTAHFLAVVSLCFAPLALAEDDGKLTIEIPSAVQATIAKEKGDSGKIREFKRVNETDGTTYLIGLTLDGKNYQLALDAAGRVMKKEIENNDDGPRVLKVSELPVNVRQTIQREAGAGLIKEIEMHEARTTYVTDVTIGKRNYRITVDSDGALVSKEYLGDDEEK